LVLHVENPLLESSLPTDPLTLAIALAWPSRRVLDSRAGDTDESGHGAAAGVIKSPGKVGRRPLFAPSARH